MTLRSIDLHRTVIDRMAAAGLKCRRVRRKAKYYVAEFYGPAVNGVYPFVIIYISQVEAQLPGIVEDKCQNALRVYNQLLKDGPPAT